jgi:hypothetical protein
MRLSRLAGFALTTAVLVHVARAGDLDWTPPSDGLLSPKQADAVLVYLTALKKTKDRFDDFNRRQRERKGQGSLSDLTELLSLPEKTKADVAEVLRGTGLKSAELDWAAAEVCNITSALILSKTPREFWARSIQSMKNQVAQKEELVSDLEKAKAAGLLPMTPGEREEAKRTAQSAITEAEKALEEAQPREKEAKATLDLVRAEAEKASASVKPSADQAVEAAQKAWFQAKTATLDAERARDAARLRLQKIDRPVAPEDKGAVDDEYAAREVAIKQEIEKLVRDRDAYVAMQSCGEKESAEVAIKRFPAANVKLVQDRLDALARVYDDLGSPLAVLLAQNPLPPK